MSTDVEQIERHLYVPNEHISWDAQVEYGLKLYKLGVTVAVHNHSSSYGCSDATPNGSCMRTPLTPGGSETRLVPISNTEDTKSSE